MLDFQQGATALHLLLQDQAEALRNASSLLGGPKWLRRADQLIEDLQTDRRMTERSVTIAQAILKLLRLEMADAEGSEEAARFAAINPTWPVVEDICLLSEAFHEALEQSTQPEMISEVSR